MKKCPRCQCVYHMDERSRCLYCDTMLLSTDRDSEARSRARIEEAGFSMARALVKKLLGSRHLEDHAHKEFLVGTYFKTRTFSFMYAFSRNEYKIGKTYKRFLIQPLTLYSLFMLPWIVYDFIDSVIFRLTYNSYCEKCGCKFIRYLGEKVHNPDECEYNQEFALVVDNIVTGRIAEEEPKLRWRAEQKLKEGKKSAYKDLCASKTSWSSVWDIVCIWFSISLIVIIVVVGVLPRAIKVIRHFGGDVESVYEDE